MEEARIECTANHPHDYVEKDYPHRYRYTGGAGGKCDSVSNMDVR